jgi:hypothetical protein
VAYQQGGRTGRIEGEELNRSRALRADLDKSIHELGAMIGRSLGEELEGVRLGGGLIKFDNDKVIIEKGGRCWVLEDPPGLSRPCTDAENTGMVQCLAPTPDTILKS